MDARITKEECARKCRRCVYKHTTVDKEPCVSCKFANYSSVLDNYTPDMDRIKNEKKRDKLINKLRGDGFDA